MSGPARTGLPEVTDVLLVFTLKTPTDALEVEVTQTFGPVVPLPAPLTSDGSQDDPTHATTGWTTRPPCTERTRGSRDPTPTRRFPWARDLPSLVGPEPRPSSGVPRVELRDGKESTSTTCRLRVRTRGWCSSADTAGSPPTPLFRVTLRGV